MKREEENWRVAMAARVNAINFLMFEAEFERRKQQRRARIERMAAERRARERRDGERRQTARR